MNLLRTNRAMPMPMPMPMPKAMVSGALRRRLLQLAAATLVAGVGAVGSAVAQTQSAGSGAGSPGMRAERSAALHPGMDTDVFTRSLDRMLDGAGADDAQRARIRHIVQGSEGDVAMQRGAGRGLRVEDLRIFLAPMGDSAAVESLRQQLVTQRDPASGRVLQTMLDVADVLTPEQRARLTERIRRHAERMSRRTDDRSPRAAPGNG